MDKKGLSTLLDLHQALIDQEDGYWIKIEAWKVVVRQSSRLKKNENH
jgi:hypothetical protein